MKNSRISSPRKMVSCLAMIFFPLWKFLPMNITQMSGPCSKVSLKVVLLHNGNRLPSVPLAHAANGKESYEGMKLLLGKIKYDEVMRWSQGYSECNSVTQNTAVSCVSGTAGTRRISMKINCGLNEHHWRQGRKTSSILLPFFRRKFICPFAHKAGPHEKLCERYG